MPDKPGSASGFHALPRVRSRGVVVQLSLFPDALQLESVDPARNRFRFYDLRVSRDLFGAWVLARHWGRIGARGRHAAQSFPSAGVALDALSEAAKRKARRGYRHA